MKEGVIKILEKQFQKSKINYIFYFFIFCFIKLCIKIGKLLIEYAKNKYY